MNIDIYETGYGYDELPNHINISDKPIKIINGNPILEIDNFDICNSINTTGISKESPKSLPDWYNDINVSTTTYTT